GPSACLLEDRVDYALPGGPLGGVAAARWIARDLGRSFRFRHTRTPDDLARHQAMAGQGRLRGVGSRSTGLGGRHLCACLRGGGHQVDRLVRRARSAEGEIRWDPAAGTIDGRSLEGADGVVHLAGESVAAGRWTAARRQAIHDSRVASTRLLAETLAGLPE